MQALLVAAIAAVGVDVGWQPAKNGNTEYIIQIEPHQLKTLKPGDKIQVGVQPHLRNISSFQIVVGEAVLPRTHAAPKLSLSAADDQPIDAIQPIDKVAAEEPAEEPVVARRYPNRWLPNDDSSSDDSSQRVVQPRSDPELPVTDTRSSSRRETQAWPARAAAGNADEYTPVPSSSRTQRPTSPNVEGSPLLPGFQPVGNDDANESRAAEPDRRQPAVGSQRRPSDIGDDENPVDATGMANGTTQGDSGFRPYDRSRETGREPSDTKRTTSAPDFAAPGGGSTSADNPSYRAADATPESRYPDLEPTLPRLSVDTGVQPRDTSTELPRTSTADSSRSIEQIRRDMTRSRENRADARPLTSDPGPATYQIQPGAAQDPVGEAPRMAATSTGPAVLPADGTASGEKNLRAPAAVPVPGTAIPRPWLPLTLSLMALFASLGGNLYLGWVTLDLRRRFRHFARGLRFHEEDRRASSLVASGSRDFD